MNGSLVSKEGRERGGREREGGVGVAREDGRERGREGEKGGVKDGGGRREGGRRREKGSKGEDMGTQWNRSWG